MKSRRKHFVWNPIYCEKNLSTFPIPSDFRANTTTPHRPEQRSGPPPLLIELVQRKTNSANLFRSDRRSFRYEYRDEGVDQSHVQLHTEFLDQDLYEQKKTTSRVESSLQSFNVHIIACFE